MSKKTFFRGTFLLTCAGLLSRIMGFFYRIFLSHTIGAEGIGLFQLVLPLQTLLLAITSSGIQTALSRLIAAHFATGEHKKARDFFCLGTLLAFLFSCVASSLLFLKADFFAVQILREVRTEELLRILAFSLPLAVLHSCINSYYFARKKAAFPSGMQFVEQLVRVGSSFLLYLICVSNNLPVTAMIAVGGTLASELAASILSLLVLSLHFRSCSHRIFQITKPFSDLHEILRTAFPVTVNRLLLSVLAGIEVVLIPQRLQMYGVSSSEALSIYGIFTGLALPCILFPATSHQLCLRNAHAFCRRNAGSRIPKKDTLYYCSDTSSQPAARLHLYSYFLLCRSLYRGSSFSKSDCRSLYTDPLFYLPLFVPEYNSDKHPTWAWADRTKPCS